MAQLVITAVGPDRPGLVHEFTGHLLEAGCNVADSRMINLRGQFALLLLAEGSDEVLARVRQGVTVAGKNAGLTVTVSEQSTTVKVTTGVPYRLKTYSLDQPGIVHRVSRLLQSHGINIEELDTRLESAAFAGSPLFTMTMKLTVPSGVSVKKLRGELDSVCETLNCDVDLEPA